MNRKEFIKRTCFTGACACGFSAITMAAAGIQAETSEESGENSEQLLIQTWIADLLSNIDDNLEDNQMRSILKACSSVHFENLQMDNVLAPYKNNLEGFIKFLTENWGWKVNYDRSTKTLIADENKNYCVCPMINKESDRNQSALCYCSEGFAEKMFSVVCGYSVSATVISSIQRGDERCIYKVNL
ncbi:MAG TPA: hypothetical protein VEP89_01310 [Draconibacterium sp.]|nr:hypothetical protein [Draconibacterium sp.]